MIQKRVVPYTKKWERIANQLARNFTPSIDPCVECGNPVVSGYCCTFCESIDPSGTPEQQKEFWTWVKQHNANLA